ncbi:MAG TPA: FAD-dependent oxidoreductase [Bellilinea sp.]|nr:FAD-dependent oxidoreductase [Bellilinea sp.]
MSDIKTKYLIVGGGMTADAAIRGIREHDADGKIVLVSQETVPPYDRPPLSKGLWTKKKKVEQIWRGTDKFDVDFHLGREVVTLDPAKKICVDDQGSVYTYDKLLLATGATPIHLKEETGKVIYYRTYADYEQLRALANDNRSFTMIGGGYIGSEIAAALRMAGNPVSMVFMEDGIIARLVPPAMSAQINEMYTEKGVKVYPGQSVNSILHQDNQMVVETEQGLTIKADVVVAGLGVRPNTRLAEAAGIKVDNGIVVDESMRTSAPDIYAAGDVARYFNPALNRTIRTEHEENANKGGKVAGEAMAGHSVSYTHLPFAYSDLFELGFEMIGIIDPRLPMVGDWKDPYRTGVVYYFEAGRVVGVLLVNTWDRIDQARALIESKDQPSTKDIKGFIA